MGFSDTVALIAVVSTLFVALPWLILHYTTQWKKTGGALSVEDEKLLDELYELGRKLDERVGTIERIMTAENPGWRHLTADPASTGLERPIYSERNPIQ